MPRTGADILDGKVGQRVEGVRFDVLDADGNVVDVVKPSLGKAGTVTWNSTSKIGRSLSGVEFDPIERAKLTPGKHRLRPSWLLPLTGDEYPLGVYLYLGGAEPELAGGTWAATREMPDRGHQLDQLLDNDFGIAAGASLTTALSAVAQAAGITDTAISASTLVNGVTPLAWAIGETTRLKIAETITNLLGYLPVYFNNAGTMVARPAPVPGDDAPDRVYAVGQLSRIRLNSVTGSSSVATRPNVYIVRSTSPTGSLIAARYEIPSTEVNSQLNLGYWIPQVTNVPGLLNNAQALVTAQALAARAQTVVKEWSFDSDADPRHDSWNVIDFRGTPALETGWTLPLEAGAKMRHTVRAAYS